MTLLACIAPRFHLVDLETTGLQAGRDRIVEIAVLTVEDGREVDAWSTLVDPGQPIPPSSTRIHGITDAMITGSPGIDQAVDETLRRVGDAAVLAHNAPFDRSFLEAACGEALPNAFLDTLRLFQDLRPEWGEHSIDALCARFDLEPEEHRALDDCRALLVLLERLLAEEENEEGAGLRLLLPYHRANDDPWSGFVERSLERVEATSDVRKDARVSPRRTVRRTGEDALSADATAIRSRVGPIGSRTDPEGSEIEPGAAADRRTVVVHPSDADAESAALQVLREELPPAETWFREKGHLASGIDGFEVREEQARMAAYVDALLAEGGVGAVEAGTGVGKTFAYLVPAMLRLARHGGRVVLSTYTKLLQDQVHRKDLPTLVRLVGSMPVAVVKGQSNYLCMARLEDAIEEAQGTTATREDREAVALLAQFARRSETGILDDLPQAALRMRPAMRDWVARVRAAGACRPRPGGGGLHPHCPYPAAIRAAETANLVVTNHAQVLRPPAAFPPFEVAILDEAHELEGAATDAYSVSFDSRAIRRVLQDLRGKGSRAGLLSRLRRELRGGEMPGSLASVERAAEAAVRALPEPSRFFGVLARGAGRSTRGAGGTNGRSGRGDATLSFRVGASIESDPRFPAFEQALESLGGSLEQIAKHLETVLEDAPTGRFRTRRGRILREDLEVTRGTLREGAEALEAFRTQTAKEACRSCAELSPEGEWSLTVEPIAVGRPLYTQFLSGLRAGLFVSATLGLPGDAHFVLRRLGWEWVPAERRADPLFLGSPFPYERNVLVGVPTDHPPLPRPGQDDRRYLEETARVIERIASRLGGRTLALFTSIRRMERVADRLRVPLEEKGIALRVGTGLTSRERLASQLRRDARCVVFGSKTFMQGIDVPGKGLSCVILERIPFDPPSRPITEARREAEGAEAFERYQLPTALLALRQAAGRLVRRSDDRGAILLLHAGVASKGYFEAVKGVLPPGRLLTGRREDVLREIEEAFAAWGLER